MRRFYDVLTVKVTVHTRQNIVLSIRQLIVIAVVLAQALAHL